MEDLLKDAIADAKAVRETAIENAKLALEEAFTPTIQSMLSKKLQAEMSEDDMEDEDEEEMEDEEAPEEGHYSEDEEEAEEAPAEDEEEMDAEDEVDESEVIEINGVKYIPLVSEEDDEEEMEDEMGDEEDEMEDEELDLEAIIRELEDELEEAKDDDEVDEAKDTEEVDEAKDTEEVDEAKDDEVDESKDDEVDESDDVDLEEVIKAIEEEEEKEEEVNELETVKSELKDYRESVKVLRGQLSEVNMLNAKLLFTNKLFRAFGLSEAQKVKVIETFDRAKNIREVKLVYSTLAESFGSERTPVNESVKIKGSASKVQASTKSVKTEEVITEGTEMRDRFKKLANIL
jgi:hypothetical protein|tara:strand:- start:513 stop:1553 length:1041 start_codon:yes stop_codon:yes gene_type:complete